MNIGCFNLMGTSAASNLASRAGGRVRWMKLLPLFVVIVVVGEIWFLGQLDVVKNISIIEGWSESHSVFLPIPSSKWSLFVKDKISCEDWLESEDAVIYERDFRAEPVLVSGSDQDWSSCSVGCKFGTKSGRTPDAAFGFSHHPSTLSVHWSMESSHYYADNNLVNARRKGYEIVMTTSLWSDLPVGYFSVAEYDIMAPLEPKTEDAFAAAFRSNCGARNFRLQTLDLLQKLNIQIHSYGACHRNRDGNGAIPVVIGAPNILDFAPSPDSVLHIKELKKHLATK